MSDQMKESGNPNTDREYLQDQPPAEADSPDQDIEDTPELKEPSVEKDPGEEPKAPDSGNDDSEPSHQAQGIGVVPAEPPQEN